MAQNNNRKKPFIKFNKIKKTDHSRDDITGYWHLGENALTMVCVIRFMLAPEGYTLTMVRVIRFMLAPEGYTLTTVHVIRFMLATGSRYTCNGPCYQVHVGT